MRLGTRRHTNGASLIESRPWLTPSAAVGAPIHRARPLQVQACQFGLKREGSGSFPRTRREFNEDERVKVARAFDELFRDPADKVLPAALFRLGAHDGEEPGHAGCWCCGEGRVEVDGGFAPQQFGESFVLVVIGTSVADRSLITRVHGCSGSRWKSRVARGGAAG